MTTTAPVARWAPTLVGALFWVVVPVLCLVSLGLGIGQLATHRTHTPPGVHGTFFVTERDCRLGPCGTVGNFSADDQTVLLSHVIGNDEWLAGRTYGAIYNAKTGRVGGLPGTCDPSPSAIGMAGALVYLCVWAWCLQTRRRAR